MNNKENIKNILTNYLPIGSIDIILDIIIRLNIELKITNPRKTKLGDYRVPFFDKAHQITINNDLNQYEFLIVLIHELAHLFVWKRYGQNVSPHGKEWKNIYKNLIWWFLSKKIFPNELNEIFKSDYLNKENFTSSFSDKLREKLDSYSFEKNEIRLKDIPENSIFELKNGRKFIKMNRIRKRYKCMELANGKYYAVHQLSYITKFEKL